MKYKKYLIIISVLVVVLALGFGITYAWYTWSSSEEDETLIITTSTGAATVIYNGGSDIEDAKLLPTATKEEGIVKTVTIKAKEENPFTLTFNLYLDIDTLPDELKEESFIYEIYKDGVFVKKGNFSQDYLDSNLVECTINDTNHIVLIENDTITTTKATYTLYLWIDGVNFNNPADMGGQLFEFKLHASGENAIVEGPLKLVDLITNLYTNATKTTVTNNSIVYNYANIYYNEEDGTNSGLMNDRLGDSSVDIDGGNIRYYGINPNNYIYFNCNNYNNQGLTDEDGNANCELWRIIGVFDGKVKIMRNENIGTYAWDNKTSGVGSSQSSSGSNDWSDSRLMIMLNPTTLSDAFDSTIYEYTRGVYWNSGSSTCYAGSSSGTKECDFSNTSTITGLKNDTTRNMISESTWYLGGHNSNSVYSNQMYAYERGTAKCSACTYETTWTGYIALAYPSDYGYAADFNTCSSYKLSAYNTTNCTSVNWMKNIITNSGSYAGWLLTPRSSYSHYAWRVLSSGNVNSSNLYVYSAIGVAPVLYLDSELTIESGTGLSTDPYRISVS